MSPSFATPDVGTNPKGGGKHHDIVRPQVGEHINPPRNYVRLKAGKDYLYLPLGNGPCRITDGYGGWTEVTRPRDIPITRWVGSPTLRMELPILLNGYEKRRGVERQLKKLLALARKGDGDNEPAKFKLKGAVPFSGENRLWVIESTPSLDNEIWSRQGSLLRQSLVLPLMEHEGGKQIKFTRSKAKGKNTYTTKPGDTLRKIAAKLEPDKNVSDYARKIGALNTIRDIRRVLDPGTDLRLP